MATATQISAQTQARIRSPLHKLRGAIRRYIILEAAASFLLILSLVYWAGLAFDFGGFKLTGVDLVQVFPHWFRWIVLACVVFFIAIVMIVKLVRLTRNFRDESLALVLERRFPKLLGDRLITAVELTDLDDAEACGYSRPMILKTVDDVSQIVGQLPIREVFNWGRIYWRFALFFFLTIVLFLAAMIGDMVAYSSTNPVHFAIRHWHKSSIWAERNLLVWDTLWPRRAQLELVNFPESGELRIGRDAPSPRIQVRALKWVIADRNASGGWRALNWGDLYSQEIGDLSVPALPEAVTSRVKMLQVRFTDNNQTHFEEWERAKVLAWNENSSHYYFAALDEVENLLADSKVRQEITEKASVNELHALDDMLEHLGERAANPRNERKFRKLSVPRDVTIFYWGQKIDNNMPLTRQQDGFEFTGVLSDLRESVKFYVKGEDFVTYPNRTITLVPPPMITHLERDEYVPAYHFYRLPAGGKAEDLKSKKQLRAAVGTSLTGSTSRIEIETGSHMTLRGEVDKDLSAVAIRYRTAKTGDKPAKVEVGAPAAGGGEMESLPVGANLRTFEKKFENITQPIEFDIELTDTDNVKSLRHIVVQPKEDRAPDVDVAVEVIRKTPQGYMCTAVAMIPFSGRIRDVEGLSKIDYTVSYTKIESPQAAGIRAGIATGVLGGLSQSPNPFETFAAPALIDVISRLSESREAVVPVPPLPLNTFVDLATARDRDFAYSKDKLPELLNQPPPPDVDRRMIRAFELRPNLEYLDLQERIPEMKKAAENALIAPRFRMRVTVMAVDNNVETGPRSGLNKETFTFLVVPYEELLGEIAKDDQNLGDKLADAVAKLEDARLAIDKVIERMPTQAGSDEFRPAASRLSDQIEVVTKNHDVVQEILNECNRTLKELEMNRVPQARIDSKQTICTRLDEALRNLFPAAEEAHAAFLRQLEDRRIVDPIVIQNSRLRQKELVEHLAYTRELLGTVASTDVLASKLRPIIDGTNEVKRILQQLKDDAEAEITWELGTLELKADNVEMQKGERKVVAVDFIRTDLDSRLRVRLKPTGGSNLTIAETVQVPSRANRMQFEIVAGNTTGDFTVQIFVTSPAGTPARMKPPFDKMPFSIKVKVK